MEYKQIKGKIICYRNGSETVYAPETEQFIDDEQIPWIETDKTIVRLADYSFVFSDAPDVFEALKQQKKDEIAAARYEYEIAGVVFDGVHVTTDREDQAMITAVALSAVADPTYTTVWKGADGYLTLNAAETLAMARIVGAHVEAAFEEEKRLSELIDAAQTEEELASITWTLN